MKRNKRTWTIAEKLSILKEGTENGIIETCRKYSIYQSLYYTWKTKYDNEGQEGLMPQYGRKYSEQEVGRIKKENGLLKQLLAEKELELQLKTELLKKKMQQWKNEGK